jgi:hypothetical protein
MSTYGLTMYRKVINVDDKDYKVGKLESFFARFPCSAQQHFWIYFQIRYLGHRRSGAIQHHAPELLLRCGSGCPSL